MDIALTELRANRLRTLLTMLGIVIGIASVIPVAHGYFDPDNPSKGARERIRACAVEVGRLLKLGLKTV